jgi:hypothetical protein
MKEFIEGILLLGLGVFSVTCLWMGVKVFCIDAIVYNKQRKQVQADRETKGLYNA